MELNPTLNILWANKGNVLKYQGKYEEALKCYNQANLLQPNGHWLELAWLHEHFKNFNQALDCIEEAIKFNPNEPYLQRVKLSIVNGIKYGQNFHIPVSTSIFLKKIPPEDEIIYSTRLKIIYEKPYGTRGKKRYKLNSDALMTHQGFVSIFPTWGIRYVSWGLVKFPISTSNKPMKGKMRVSLFKIKLIRAPSHESEEQFKLRFAEFPNIILELRLQKTKELLDKVKDYVKFNDYENAFLCIENTIRCNPMGKGESITLECLNNKAYILYKLGRYEESLGISKKVLFRNSRNRLALINKAKSLVMLEEYKKAIKAYNKLLKSYPNDAEFWYSKGTLQKKLGKIEEGSKSVSKAMELDPNMAEIDFFED